MDSSAGLVSIVCIPVVSHECLTCGWGADICNCLGNAAICSNRMQGMQSKGHYFLRHWPWFCCPWFINRVLRMLLE